jgi:hypothetical protein
LAPAKHTTVPKVVTQILHYFRTNPAATDTLEGIARWRLLEEQIQRSLQETQLALEWLVEKGFLLEESRVSSGKLYRLNPDKSADIASFLKRSERNGSSEAEGRD